MDAINQWVVLALAIGLVGTMFALVVTRYFASIPSPGDAANIAWYIRKAKQWNGQARVLRSIQVTLAVVAIIASVLSASRWKPMAAPEGFLAVLAAITIALLTGLDLTGQANKVRNAARHLTVSILEYGQSTEPKSLDKVLSTYREAENLVGDYRPQVPAR